MPGCGEGRCGGGDQLGGTTRCLVRRTVPSLGGPTALPTPCLFIQRFPDIFKSSLHAPAAPAYPLRRLPVCASSPLMGCLLSRPPAQQGGAAGSQAQQAGGVGAAPEKVGAGLLFRCVPCVRAVQHARSGAAERLALPEGTDTSPNRLPAAARAKCSCCCVRGGTTPTRGAFQVRRGPRQADCLQASRAAALVVPHTLCAERHFPHCELLDTS